MMVLGALVATIASLAFALIVAAKINQAFNGDRP